MRRAIIKSLLKNILALIFGISLALVLVEIFFTILPVSDSTKTQDVNDAEPYMRFEPNRIVKVSIGKFFDIKVKKTTNAQGFFDDLSFDSESTQKRVAVIGDSYVQALQVKNDEAIHGRLNSMLGKGWRVNGVGTSGSPLSQYVAYAEYVKKNINPDIYVFVIIENDFDESLYRYKRAPGHHYYNDDFQLVRVDYKTDSLKSLLRVSSTARYFAINLEGYSIFRNRKVAENQGASDLYAYEERLAWSRKAVDKFLNDISSISDGKPIILIADGDRPAIYEGQFKSNSFARQMMSYIVRNGRDRANTYVVDLHPVFLHSFEADNKKFNFEIDYHWNAHGHQLAANEVFRVINNLKEK